MKTTRFVALLLALGLPGPFAFSQAAPLGSPPGVSLSAFPNCPSGALAFTSSSGTFSCASSGGAPAFGTITSGTNTAAAMVLGTGSSLTSTGGVVTLLDGSSTIFENASDTTKQLKWNLGGAGTGIVGTFNVSFANAGSYNIGPGGGSNSVVLGPGAVASVIGTIAIGSNASCNGSDSICIGVSSTVTSTAQSMVFGGDTTSANNDVLWGSNGINADNWYFGRGKTTNANVQNILFQPTPASGTNVGGGTFTFYGGNSTGNVGGGSLFFYTAPAGSSGSGQNTETLALTIDSTQTATFVKVPTLPSQSTNTFLAAPSTGSGVPSFRVLAASDLTGLAVTSVGISAPGIFTVSGSPVTSSGTLTLTATGTSGGIPYFNSTTTMTSSGALTSNVLVKGGGAGAAPTNSSITDNGTTVTFTEDLLAGTGSQSLPVYAFSGATGDGMSDAGSGPTFSVGGSYAFAIRSSQVFTQGNGAVGTPAYSNGSGNTGLYFPSSTTFGLSSNGGLYLNSITNGLVFINDAILDNTNNALYENATGKIGWVSTAAGSLIALTAPDTMLTRNAAAVVQHGAADAAAPVAQTIRAQGVVTGTTNTAGATFTIQGSASTGNVGGGSIVFQTTPAGSSGSTPNTQTTALSLNSAGQVVVGQNGLVATPELVNANFATTGIFWAAGPLLKFSTNGSLALMLNASQQTVPSNGTTALPGLSGQGSQTTGFDWATSNVIGIDINAVSEGAITSSGLVMTTAGQLGISSASTPESSAADTILTRRAAATWNFGAADVAAPVAQTLTFQDVVAGTSNTPGTNATLVSPLGTGTGAGASFGIARALIGATGSTQQSSADAIRVCESKSLSTTSATPTTMATVAAPSNSSGAIRYTVSVQCSDGTNFDADVMSCTMSYVNKGGTITIAASGTPQCTATIPADNSGSCTIASTVTAGSSLVNIVVTPIISTIVPTSVTGILTVEDLGSGGVTCK